MGDSTTVGSAKLTLLGWSELLLRPGEEFHSSCERDFNAANTYEPPVMPHSAICHGMVQGRAKRNLISKMLWTNLITEVDQGRNNFSCTTVTQVAEIALPCRNNLSRLRGGGGFFSIRLQTLVSVAAAATAPLASRLQISRKCASSAFLRSYRDHQM